MMLGLSLRGLETTAQEKEKFDLAQWIKDCELAPTKVFWASMEERYTFTVDSVGRVVNLAMKSQIGLHPSQFVIELFDAEGNFKGIIISPIKLKLWCKQLGTKTKKGCRFSNPVKIETWVDIHGVAHEFIYVNEETVIKFKNHLNELDLNVITEDDIIEIAIMLDAFGRFLSEKNVDSSKKDEDKVEIRIKDFFGDALISFRKYSQSSFFNTKEWEEGIKGFDKEGKPAKKVDHELIQADIKWLEDIQPLHGEEDINLSCYLHKGILVETNSPEKQVFVARDTAYGVATAVVNTVSDYVNEFANEFVTNNKNSTTRCAISQKQDSLANTFLGELNTAVKLYTNTPFNKEWSEDMQGLYNIGRVALLVSNAMACAYAKFEKNSTRKEDYKQDQRFLFTGLPKVEDEDTTEEYLKELRDICYSVITDAGVPARDVVSFMLAASHYRFKAIPSIYSNQVAVRYSEEYPRTVAVTSMFPREYKILFDQVFNSVVSDELELKYIDDGIDLEPGVYQAHKGIIEVFDEDTFDSNCITFEQCYTGPVKISFVVEKDSEGNIVKDEEGNAIVENISFKAVKNYYSFSNKKVVAINQLLGSKGEILAFSEEEEKKAYKDYEILINKEQIKIDGCNIIANINGVDRIIAVTETAIKKEEIKYCYLNALNGIIVLK